MNNRGTLSQLDDVQALALCIYGEARGEGIDGMLGVASVVINRAAMSRKTVRSVCLHPKQFSCFNDSDPNREVLDGLSAGWTEHITTNKHLRQAYWIAKGMIEKYLMSNVGNATHYHHVSIKPSWADKLQKVTRLGNHQFYFEKGWK